MSAQQTFRRRIMSVGLLSTALLTVACGPTVFADTAPIQIAGALPPPPPEPEPEPEPAKPQRVEVTADKIVIHDKILFEVDKAIIKEESFGLLDEIVSVIQGNPHIKKISIEGHTDSDGSDKYNQKLSEKRAASVMTYLKEHGVEESRLASAGFGESKPIDSNDTDSGKSRNRRVEFIITEQDEIKKVYEVDPQTGERREVSH